MSIPAVSVVMGVCNGGERLSRTLDSVLSQQGVDFEFIVVDDGSTDDTAVELARRSAEDARLRVLTNPKNIGLTQSLIYGCDEARGRYIARQDCGDRSLPGRLQGQMAWLEAHPAAVMVSCHTRVTGVYGETVFEKRISAETLSQNLLHGVNGTYAGPSHHGSVMMRTDAYRRVAGYRQPFVVAQDLDLWLRLVEVGPVGVVDLLGYDAEASPTGISAQRLDLQRRLADFAATLARARRSGAEESSILASAASYLVTSTSQSRVGAAYRHAAYLYFLGRCVGRKDSVIARRYFRDGIARCPWLLRNWYGLARTWF